MAKPTAICVRSRGLADGGSDGGTGSSIDGSPKVVGAYSLETLPMARDDSTVVRDRIRDNHNLLMKYDFNEGKAVSHGYIDAVADNVKLNAPVLKPLVGLMKDHDLQLPGIEPLISAIDGFYQLCKVARSNDLVYQEAWTLRRLIGKLKKYLYRPFPPQACCYEFSISSKNICTHQNSTSFIHSMHCDVDQHRDQ